MSLVIKGRIVPLTGNTAVAASEDAAFSGRVWIGDDGLIAAVTKGAQPGPPGFANAPIVDVGTDLVIPGLIDLHSHLAYATLPLWSDPDRTEPYLHHNDWPKRKAYAPGVTWPAYAFIEAAPLELLAYAELRAIVGGTTSIQGSPPKNRPLDGWMVRNFEDERLGGAVRANQVLASTLTMTQVDLVTRAGQMRQGATFVYHCAEGKRGSVVSNEYSTVGTVDALQKRLVAIHTNAVQPESYDSWKDEAGTIVWSPFSNLWLYGETTDIPAARSRGIRVCIGSDWGPSGTRNVLGELKVASLVNKNKGWQLTDFELVKMVTAHPGDVLGMAWGVQGGRLEPNALADIAVIDAAAGAKPFEAIVAATEKKVRLVVVRGQPVYGVSTLMDQAGAAPISSIDVAGQKRSVALTRLDDISQALSFADVMTRLDEVKKDPKKEIEKARGEALRAAREEPSGSRLRFALDMPTGIAPIGGLPKDLSVINVPPIQPLFHDSAFFASITGHGFHNGLLDGLAVFYS